MFGWIKRLFYGSKVEEWRDKNGSVFLRIDRDFCRAPHGITEEFNEAGVKTFEANYKHGKLDGKVIYFDDDGNVVSEYLYRDNVLIKHDG